MLHHERVEERIHDLTPYVFVSLSLNKVQIKSAVRIRCRTTAGHRRIFRQAASEAEVGEIQSDGRAVSQHADPRRARPAGDPNAIRAMPVTRATVSGNAGRLRRTVIALPTMGLVATRPRLCLSHTAATEVFHRVLFSPALEIRFAMA